MKIFNGRVDLDLSKFIVRYGNGIGWTYWLFDWKGVPLWYTAPHSLYGESISYAPDDMLLPKNWHFYGSEVKVTMDRKRVNWWLTKRNIDTKRFKASTEEALDQLVAAVVEWQLRGGDNER